MTNKDILQHQNAISLAQLWAKLTWAASFYWVLRWWILCIGLLFGTLGYIYSSLKNPTYSASLTFSLEQGGSTGGLYGLASQFGISMNSGGDGLNGDNLLSLMTSRRILNDVLFSKIYSAADSSILLNLYVETSPNLLKNWKSQRIYPFNQINDVTRKQDSAIGTIVDLIKDKSLVISKVDKKLSLVTVVFTGHNPDVSKNFVELLTAKATDFYVETKMANARANIYKLERRADSVMNELNIAMLGYAKTQERNKYIVEAVEQVPGMERQIKVTMLTTLYGELVKNLELSKTLMAHEEPLITIIDTPHYPMMVPSHSAKNTAIASFVGVLLTMIFFGARELFKNISNPN